MRRQLANAVFAWAAWHPLPCRQLQRPARLRNCGEATRSALADLRKELTHERQNKIGPTVCVDVIQAGKGDKGRVRHSFASLLRTRVCVVVLADEDQARQRQIR